MDNYECNVCKYITKYKKDYIKHNKTKKHIKKVTTCVNLSNLGTTTEYVQNVDISLTPHGHLTDTSKTPNMKRIFCEYCNLEFSRTGSLTRHKKICTNKNNENTELLNKIKLLETNNEHNIKEKEHYKAEADHYKQMLREAGGLVKKSVSSLTYAMDNYNTAPALKVIEVDEIKYFDETEKKIVEDVLSAYKHKTVGKYLGDLIIKIHKKDDPKTQSIWNTDDNRLTYLIKELVHNESSNWIIDKKGIKTNTYLIEPLLTHVKSLLISYQTNFPIPDKHNSVEMEFILENSKSVIELVNDIDDGIIGKDILKHISSHLRFPTKAIE